jgi:hypothetical protein
MSNRTGYFLPTDQRDNSKGYLRHTHSYYTQDHILTERWHPASQVHVGDAEAHTIAQSWVYSQTVWAVCNKNISDFDKALLIAQAKEYHDARR